MVATPLKRLMEQRGVRHVVSCMKYRRRFGVARLTQSVESIHEQSVQIALDFLMKSGQPHDPQDAFEFIGRYTEKLIREGRTSVLMLSNLAIIAYKKHLEERPLRLVQ